MKPLIVTAAALALTACAPLPNTTRTLLTTPMFDQYIIGGADYPVVVRGAEAVGLTPDALAERLRFPSYLPSGSGFRAVRHGPGLVDHAHLDVTTRGDTATAVLSFRNGERRIGEGSFTLNRADFQNADAVGSSSAIVIATLLDEAREELRDSETVIWIPY